MLDTKIIVSVFRNLFSYVGMVPGWKNLTDPCSLKLLDSVYCMPGTLEGGLFISAVYVMCMLCYVHAIIFCR